MPHLPKTREDLRQRLPAACLKQGIAPLCLGRFYPSALLKQPAPAPVLRLIACEGADFEVDFNPPLALHDYSMSRDSAALDIAATGTAKQLLAWAGMEAALEACDTDFFVDNAMQREDENDDTILYATPAHAYRFDLCGTTLKPVS